MQGDIFILFYFVSCVTVCRDTHVYEFR